MPQLIDLEWDSLIFGGKSGLIDDYRQIPRRADLYAYQYVHVRIPSEETGFVWKYEKIGFRYITLDFCLEKTTTPVKFNLPKDCNILTIQKQQPTFQVSGFKVEGSRLVIDPELNQHLGKSFWDEMIREHCRDFADFVLCMVGHDRRLIGSISCFDRSDTLDMFLVVVHPDFQGLGIGVSLIKAAEARAHSVGKKLTTSVVAHNIRALNFYFQNGFTVNQAFIVMHYSNS